MSCKQCGVVDDKFFGFCNKCSQKVSFISRYPELHKILAPGYADLIDQMSSNSGSFVDVICQQCGEIFNIKLDSLLTQYRKRSCEEIKYRCHSCSKLGKSKITVSYFDGVIDKIATLEKYGPMPTNIKKWIVVAKCEDCQKTFDVKLNSLFQQARRHKANGRSCVYKCFSCGVKRPDALEKSAESRASQLVFGSRSGLEIALHNRLLCLGITHTEQFRTHMYMWDFFLPDYNVLIDVNGEYWHSLKRNVTKDKAKITYAKKYLQEYKILIIEEKHFLNPNMVDKIILNFLEKEPTISQREFEFNKINISLLNSKKGSKRSEYVLFLNSFHYSMCGRLGKTVYGAFFDNELIAVCKFNYVTRAEVASSLNLKYSQVMEVDRFCIHPQFHKKNFASWFLSKCTKMFFTSNPLVLCLVSFADETFDHSGTIYRASNWSLIGKTKESYHYMDSVGIPINKKRVYDIASKLKMKETEYAEKHGLVKYAEKPKLKFILKRV